MTNEQNISAVRAKYTGAWDVPDIVAVKDGKIVAEVDVRVRYDADAAWARGFYHRVEVETDWRILVTPAALYVWRRGSYLGTPPEIEIPIDDAIPPGLAGPVFRAVAHGMVEKLATRAPRELGPLEIMSGAEVIEVESVVEGVTELGFQAAVKAGTEIKYAETPEEVATALEEIQSDGYQLIDRGGPLRGGTICGVTVAWKGMRFAVCVDSPDIYSVYELAAGGTVGHGRTIGGALDDLIGRLEAEGDRLAVRGDGDDIGAEGTT